MNNKYLIPIVIIVVLVLGAAVLYKSHSGVSSQVTPGTGEGTVITNSGPGTVPAPSSTQGSVGSVGNSVSVSSVTPSTASVGTGVTVTGRGFTTTGNYVVSNGIQFAANLSSSDGTTLRFTVPSAAGAYCPPATPPRPCPMFEVALSSGKTYPLAVINANGTSNAVSLMITDGGVQGSGPITTEGMHCGGFIANARACGPGFHCKLNVVADLGGVCVKD